MIELDESTEFKGWDYEELAERWEIDTDPVNLLRQYIMNSIAFDDDDEEFLLPEVKADMLEFLQKLISSKSDHHYGEYIFIGLLLTAAEDDAAFAQYYCTLLPHMWT